MSILSIVLGRKREEAASRASTISELHKKYGSAIYDYSLRMLGNRMDAEDAVQETFMNAFRSLSTFRYGDSHLPWLYRIATNVCLKNLKKRKDSPVDIYGESQQADLSESNEYRDPINELHARRVLAKLVDEIDERNLQIIAEYYLGGMNQQSIAKSLGISRRAVVKRLAGLNKKVGNLLEAEDGRE